jgi:hypothetical protein
MECHETVTKLNNLTPLYQTTEKDVIKILKERKYRIRQSDLKKLKRNSAKGGHILWFRIGINAKGKEIPQGVLLSSSSGNLAWKKQIANISKNDTDIIGVKN